MVFNKFLKLLCIIIFISWTMAVLRCGFVSKEVNKKFYRVKKCHKMNTSIIARANYNSFKKCQNFALQKNGLAFNYSPEKDNNDEEIYYTCEVLGCPDTDNLTTLVNDSRFDYYTLYGNTETLLNASCISSIGIFQINFEYENYTKAENVCRTLGGELADIVSESRTTGLAQILATRVQDWYKAAYIGLNDMETEGVFKTSYGDFLDCHQFRAWAPGHPRETKKRDDCVILDSERMWRAVNCAKKLLYICEIEPKPPFWKEMIEFGNGSCSEIKNRTMRHKCKRVKKKYKKAKKQINYKKELQYYDRCG